MRPLPATFGEFRATFRGAMIAPSPPGRLNVQLGQWSSDLSDFLHPALTAAGDRIATFFATHLH
jgi:hypothetical protein